MGANFSLDISRHRLHIDHSPFRILHSPMLVFPWLGYLQNHSFTTAISWCPFHGPWLLTRNHSYGKEQSRRLWSTSSLILPAFPDTLGTYNWNWCILLNFDEDMWPNFNDEVTFLSFPNPTSDLTHPTTSRCCFPTKTPRLSWPFVSPLFFPVYSARSNMVLYLDEDYGTPSARSPISNTYASIPFPYQQRSDVGKAVYSVDHSELFPKLTHFGFGSTFCHCIQTFYKDTLTATLINGTSRAFFQISCSVRQGDALPPGHFVVYIELLVASFFLHLHPLQHINSSPPHTTSPLCIYWWCHGPTQWSPPGSAFYQSCHSIFSAKGMVHTSFDKTVVLPFVTRNEASDTRTALQQLGIRTLAFTECTRLLYILVGGPQSTSHQLETLLHTILQRMVIWGWPAGTYLGRVLPLKSTILHLLWHVGTAHYLPPTLLTKLSFLIRFFVNKQITGQASTNAPSGFLLLMAHRQPQSTWPLITPSSATLLGYRLSILIAGINETHLSPSSPPHWLSPALYLSTVAIHTLGLDFAILYYPHMPSAQMNYSS